MPFPLGLSSDQQSAISNQPAPYRVERVTIDADPEEATMENPTTCGQGLAEHAALAARMGELVSALAQTLELHTKALDLTDAAARMELHVYQDLVQRFGNIAVSLQAVAREMERHRGLPMGAHDAAKLADAATAATFEHFVDREEQLLALLQHSLEAHRQMLDEMATTRGTA
jgi:hypothetical protein